MSVQREIVVSATKQPYLTERWHHLGEITHLKAPRSGTYPQFYVWHVNADQRGPFQSISYFEAVQRCQSKYWESGNLLVQLFLFRLSTPWAFWKNEPLISISSGICSVEYVCPEFKTFFQLTLEKVWQLNLPNSFSGRIHSHPSNSKSSEKLNLWTIQFKRKNYTSQNLHGTLKLVVWVDVFFQGSIFSFQLSIFSQRDASPDPTFDWARTRS